MAAIQGYLLQHKASSQSAIENVHGIQRTISSGQDNNNTHLSNAERTSANGFSPSAHSTVVKPRPVKRLTVEQVDKMFFNPQEGWDKDINDK